MKKDLVTITPRWVQWCVAIFLVAVTGVLYVNLGRDTLFDWDEGIYATLGSELIKTKNLFVPQWNGGTWFEKPPGIAWLSGLGQIIGGHSAFGARLFQPLVTAGVLYGIFLVGTSLAAWPVGVSAMGILATFNLFLGRSRGVNVDMPLLLGIVTTVYLLLHKKESWKVALTVAVSIWFKGVAGVLPLIIAAPLFIGQTKKYLLSTGYFLLAFIVPWHLFAYLQYGDEFVTPYVREQVMTRIATPIEFHIESRWFYFNYLYTNLGLGVIIVALVGGIACLYNAYTKKSLIYLVPVWWALVPLAIFTVAKTRLFWYILPVYPAIALLAGMAIWWTSRYSKKEVVIAILAIGMCLQGLLVSWRSVEPNKKSVTPPDRIDLISAIARLPDDELLVLVPPTERMAEAILPMDQRISSSFRYGGMPSVVYYYGRHVKFFYNVDEFIAAWQKQSATIAMVVKSDLSALPSGYRIIEESGDYTAIRKGNYAER